MKKIKNIFIRILVFLKDKNKKSFSQILKEFFLLLFLKKELPLYYFAKFLYRKEIHNYKDYLSKSETNTVFKFAAPKDNSHQELVRNKYAFEHFLTHHKVKTPYSISHNIGNKFIYNDEVFNINTEDDLLLFFENVFNRSGETKLFVKPFSEQGGKNCFILYLNNLKNQLKQYRELLVSNSFIHQALLKQHSKINAINESCINSIRFNTYIDEEGEANILSAFMRFGRNGNVVDNGSSGGFYVPINMNNGTLLKEGKQLMRFGGRVFYNHPDTKFDFNNFQIPFFEEACALVHKTALLLSYKMLGWDIAISENGPILIEANDNFSLFVGDIAYGGYLKHPFFKKILKEKNNDY